MNNKPPTCIIFHGVAMSDKANLVSADPRGLALYVDMCARNNLSIPVTADKFKFNVETEVNEAFKSVKHKYKILLHDCQQDEELISFEDYLIHMHLIVDVEQNDYYSFRIN
jgi:hypothetical protein